MRRPNQARAFGVLGVAMLLVTLPSVPASAVTLPGNRQFYVVALGNLSTPAAADWVRLAFYRFDTGGNVYETFWYYAQGTTPDKIATGLTTAGCSNNCTVWTSTGFQDGATAKTLQGTYTNLSGLITIHWPSATEVWHTTSPKSDLSRLDLDTVLSTGFKATVGTAFGSNRSTNSGISASSLASIVGTGKTWTGSYRQVDLDTNTSATSTTFTMSAIQKCNTNCLHWSTSSVYYTMAVSSGNSRKNFHEFHLTSFGYCYTGNPHLHPQLQILGDSGTFHGWVGIEASLYPDGADYLGQLYFLD